MASQQGQQIDLATLSAQQLSQVKKQLDNEIEHLTSSYQNLRSAQQKFRDCVTSIAKGVGEGVAGCPLLVPLTPSLYVPGRLASSTHVLVDVGTGFYVEKSTADASAFYNAKTLELATNIKALEGVVNAKSRNLRVVEELLRGKVLAAQQGEGAGAGASAGVGA